MHSKTLKSFFFFLSCIRFFLFFFTATGHLLSFCFSPSLYFCSAALKLYLEQPQHWVWKQHYVPNQDNFDVIHCRNSLRHMRPFMDTKHVVKLSAACKRMNAVLPQNYVLRYLEDKSVPWGTMNGFPLLKLLSKIFCKRTVHMCCWWHMRCWRCQLLLEQSYCFPPYRPDSLYNEML